MDRIKVLFIYRNKNIAKKFIEHFTINNYEVYEFYGNSIPKAKLNFWQKIENYFHRIILKNKKQIHKIEERNFNKHSKHELLRLKKKKLKFDFCFVIRGDLVPEFVIKYAHSVSTKMVDFQLDGLSVSSKILDYQKYFDDIFVFDPDDVKKYPEAALHFLPNCYFGEPDFSIPSEIDLLYIGQYLDERNVQLKNLHQYLEEHQLSYTSHTSLYRGRDFIPLHHKILHHKISTTYQENIDFVKKSKTLIDFKRDEHDGLSLRFFEAMQYGKKIITDNFSVKNYDFYHPNNIFVTNYVNLEGLVDFLQSPHQSLPSELVEKYSFKNWINTILNK